MLTIETQFWDKRKENILHGYGIRRKFFGVVV
jgi:hypothetical protein